MSGDLTGDPGGGAGGVERHGVLPDRAEAFADLFIAEVFEVDAEAVAVRELGVALPLAQEIGIDLDEVPDIHDEEGGGPAVLLCHGTGLAVRLVAGAEHGVFEAPGAPLAVAGLGAGRVLFGEEAELLRFRLRPGTLLRLHDEAVFAAEVDPAVTPPAGVSFGDRSFEAVVVGLAVALCGLGAVELQKVAEF